MLKKLRRGEKVGALMDQNTLPREGGVWVDFYGQPVPVAAATAALCLMTGAELVFGFCLPRKDGSYFIRIPSSIPAPQNVDARDEKVQTELTQAIMGKLEEAIRETPGAWLWMYKRWKYIPKGRNRVGFPFYAKHSTRT
jgi:lauroyl/myristoyl acyltransferase